MVDEYQRGSDDQWLEHSNQELSRIVKKRERTIDFLKLCLVVLIFVLCWVIFKFTRNAELKELWSFTLNS